MTKFQPQGLTRVGVVVVFTSLLFVLVYSSPVSINVIDGIRGALSVDECDSLIKYLEKENFVNIRVFKKSSEAGAGVGGGSKFDCLESLKKWNQDIGPKHDDVNK